MSNIKLYFSQILILTKNGWHKIWNLIYNWNLFCVNFVWTTFECHKIYFILFKYFFFKIFYARLLLKKTRQLFFQNWFVYININITYNYFEISISFIHPMKFKMNITSFVGAPEGFIFKLFIWNKIILITASKHFFIYRTRRKHFTRYFIHLCQINSLKKCLYIQWIVYYYKLLYKITCFMQCKPYVLKTLK